MPVLKDPFAETKKKFKDNDLREVWRRLKDQGLSALQQSHGPKARANLEAQFNKGLGPLLDQWAKEAGDLPKTPRSQLQETYDQIMQTIRDYRTAIKTFNLGGRPQMMLDGGLKQLGDELDRQVEWYKDVRLW